MQRLTAIMVGLVLIGSAGRISRLHTHAYIEHDHPEHQHGLASHDHQPSARHHDDDDDQAHLESCDPGQHQVSLTVPSVPARDTNALDLEAAEACALDPLIVVPSVPTLTDVRVHGPPGLPPGPSRAPPQTLLA